MKTLTIMIFLLLTLFFGGVIALSFMDITTEQTVIREEIKIDSLVKS